MANAILLKEISDFIREYRATDGRIVRLELEEDWSKIEFTDQSGKTSYGEFEFSELESGDFKLTRMYTNQLKRTGIGRAALEFFIEITGARIYTSPNDGIPRDDGSHLTEDAPGFVVKMSQEGLIESEEDDLDSGFLAL